MKIDLTKYDEQHGAYIESLTGRLTSIYQSIMRQAVKYGLSVNFDKEEGEIFDFDKFPRLKKKIEDLFNDMHDQITTLVQNAIDEEWQFSAEKYDYWLSEMLAKGDMTKDEIEAYIKRNNEAIKARRNEAQAAFKKRIENGMNLSDRVWKLTDQYKSELELALDAGIREGKSAQQISQDIRSYLNQPDKLFRRVRDAHGNLKLSKAAAAYHPGQGVYRSSYKNAMRVARTEVNMAYRSADHENWSADKMVIGIRISLSNNHTLNGKPFFDICDELKGVYPKEFKFTGWHPMCYSEDSEVYTDSGWKFFKDVKDTDRILSLNPDTFDLEYTNILLNFKRWHKGDMIHLYNRGLSQLVTPEHEVLYLNKNDNTTFKRISADKCGTTLSIYRSSKWKGEYKPFIQVGDQKVKIEDYAEFMGYWLSDGSLGHYPEVNISQQDDNRYNIYRCMERINGQAWMGKYKVGFNAKDWYDHLKPFGKCAEKYVPECIKQSTPEVIEIFLKAFVSCDGYVRKPKAFIGSRGTLCQSTKEERIYVTTSVRMADDIGELILKIGKRPSFYVDKIKGCVRKFRNGEYVINHDCIRISECNSVTATQYYKERIPYDGYVYDLTLEKNHIMYVRRNGKCFWGSNCRCWAVPITPTQEEITDYLKKMLAGEDVSEYKFKGEVTELPKVFKAWYLKNASRVARMKSKPYFITDNKSLIQ